MLLIVTFLRNLVIFLMINYQLLVKIIIIKLIINKFSFDVKFQYVFLLIVMLFVLFIITIGNLLL